MMSGATQTLEYFKEKCSICFDARYELCIPGCEDQFCFNCVRRYFKEVVDNSWGLSSCKMKCPVCYAVLAKEVWTKYADKGTIQRFNSFNRPFRPFSRHCSSCGEEVPVASSPAMSTDEQKQTADRILGLVQSITQDDEATFTQIRTDLKLTLGKKKPVVELYQGMVQHLESALACKVLVTTTGARVEKRRKLEKYNEAFAQTLTTAICLETEAEKWRELQHLHVKKFPKARCGKCASEMCFHCGEATWHEEDSCKEYLTKKLSNSSTELSATIQWTLENGKRCPNCSVIINRDDGCNKMACLHCGFSFCWICEGPWSTQCGFYNCGTKGEQAVGEEAEKAPDMKSNPSSPQGTITSNKRTRSGDFMPEIGVPNVIQIERKMSKIEDPGIPRSSNHSRNSHSQPSTQSRRKSLKDWFFFSKFFWF